MIWKAYLDHSYAQNLAKPPFMRMCREFENWRALSGKFLRQKSCYPESFRFLWLCWSSKSGERQIKRMQVVHNVQVHPPVRLSHVFLQLKDWWQTHPDLLISLGNEDKIGGALIKTYPTKQGWYAKVLFKIAFFSDSDLKLSGGQDFGFLGSQLRK